MVEARCKSCNRKLAEVEQGKLVIKCKCGTTNDIKVISQKSLTLGKP